MAALKVWTLTSIVFVLAGCSAPASVRDYGGGQYMATGEAEFDLNGLMNEVHAKAAATCGEQGKQLIVNDQKSGYGGTGFAGSKKMYGIQFSCR